MYMYMPDSKTCPELHALVTKYQMHKCSDYCKRRRRVGSTFITRCKFGFPRPECDNTRVNDVSDSLKKRERIYHLKRLETEGRVNDYNPLLLLLWKANIDVQYVSECSLALAQYVSGYVTKAERSSMQEQWQEISNTDNVYSKLFSFGLKSLRTRECGLYEASDILLGDNLCRKSVTVKWVSTVMPHKRKRLLKNHAKIQQLAKDDPDSDDIFAQNLLENYYPERPADMEDICLYDFVANYDFNSMNRRGERNYKKLKKPRLPNHKIFSPVRRTNTKIITTRYFFFLCPSEKNSPCCKTERRRKRHLPVTCHAITIALFIMRNCKKFLPLDLV